MKNWDAKEWVAFVLCLCVLLPFAAMAIIGVIESVSETRMNRPEGALEIITDLLKVIVGGLIGYIAGRNGNGRNGSGK